MRLEADRNSYRNKADSMVKEITRNHKIGARAVARRHGGVPALLTEPLTARPRLRAQWRRTRG